MLNAPAIGFFQGAMLRASKFTPHDAGFGLVARHEAFVGQVEAASAVEVWATTKLQRHTCNHIIESLV